MIYSRPRYFAGLLAAFGLLVMVPSAAQAGIRSWTPIGPGGGSVAAIAMDPQDPDTLYAGTQDGVLKSTDGAASWRFVYSARPARIWSIAVSNADPRVVAAAGDSLILLSRDEGATWDVLSRSEGADTVAFAPDGTLYASWSEQGLRRSSDPGRSWTSVRSGLPAGSPVYDLAFGAGSTMFAAVTEGVFRSTDGGAKWTQTGNPAVGNVFAVEWTGTLLFVRGNRGTAVSSDEGGSWRPATQGLPASLSPTGMDFVTDMTHDPAAPSRLYVTLHEGGVWISDDSGANWRPAGCGTAGAHARAVVARGERIVVATDARGILISDDRGATWAEANAGFSLQEVTFVVPSPTDPLRIFVGTFEGGLRVTSDGGRSWSLAPGLPTTVMSSMAIAPSDPLTIYLGTGGAGLWSSSDGGVSWQKAADDIGGWQTIDNLAIDPTNPAVLYAALPSVGVFVSRDRGRTWTNINNGIIPSQGFGGSVIVHPSTPSTLYVRGFKSYVSRDYGQTWNEMAGVSGNIVVGSGSTLFVWSDRQILRSDDGGASWTRATAGLPALDPGQFISTVRREAADGALYLVITTVGTTGPHTYEIYRSMDEGGYWTRLNALPRGVTVGSIGTAENRVFVGTNVGVYEMELTPPGPRRRGVRR